MDIEKLFTIRKSLNDAIHEVNEELVKLDWRHLANRGERFLATVSYRNEHKCSTSDAFGMVNSFISMLDAK